VGCVRDSLDQSVVDTNDHQTPPPPREPVPIEMIQLLKEGTPKPQSDSFNILSMNISGDQLTLKVSYGGGCEQHVFTAFYTESWEEKMPVGIALFIAHDANKDSCEAMLTEEITFDLTPIKSDFAQRYPNTKKGAASLRITGTNHQALYEF